MNLFSVEKSLWSHPDKPYITHIQNIADSFDDRAHRIAASYHDLGKLSDEFQRYIYKKTKQKTTHAIEGAYLFCFLCEKIDSDFLPIFFSIAKHHLSLPNIKDEVYRYSNRNENQFDEQAWLQKIAVIQKHINIECEHSTESFYQLLKVFDMNFSKFAHIEGFFLFKKCYSRLILADKFEAIFSKPYKNISVLSDEVIETHLQTIQTLIDQKQKEFPNSYRMKARKEIFDTLGEAVENKYLIKAPTGVGKTFIALELALKLAKKRKDKKRIITAIPFTSIIDQTHIEYEKILGEGKVLKYHHLTKYGDDNQKDEQEQFSQKIFLADTWHEHFIVTTFNQLLYTLFSNHNRDNVRLETLRDSIIIIDEVQNISRSLLKSVSFVFNEFAKEYNIDFIIMSATMPYIYKELEDFKELSKPWFYHEKNNRYRLTYQEGLGDFENLSEAIEKEKGSVLCVVNTIAKAKKLYTSINNQDTYLLTTHQTPQHRKEIIEEIKQRLSRGDKISLIATQLIEAGVDLDFDIGYREFAPFASVIQMAGRVNREGKHQTPCKVVVFDYLEDNNAPYHVIDLQEEKIKAVLKRSKDEIEILADMDRYFVDVKEQTTSVDLQIYMENLEFKTLFEKFNENFMPNQPWKVSLFIEQYEGHFDIFIDKREELFEECEDKFEALGRIKELEKDLGLYTISINHHLVEELQARKHSIQELFGRYVLPFGSKYYSKERGFDIELTDLEEAFSD
ncbi:MAG: CRISPR-associated helicase Cas3' [Epsilonproteobacteria bacterium]|nr:CRISPR-associated helicase Cas3' [Campylobacterota bacterium]